jgi:hypothetical protein
MTQTGREMILSGLKWRVFGKGPPQDIRILTRGVPGPDAPEWLLTEQPASSSSATERLKREKLSVKFSKFWQKELPATAKSVKSRNVYSAKNLFAKTVVSVIKLGSISYKCLHLICLLFLIFYIFCFNLLLEKIFQYNLINSLPIFRFLFLSTSKESNKRQFFTPEPYSNYSLTHSLTHLLHGAESLLRS